MEMETHPCAAFHRTLKSFNIYTKWLPGRVPCKRKGSPRITPGPAPGAQEPWLYRTHCSSSPSALTARLPACRLLGVPRHLWKSPWGVSAQGCGRALSLCYQPADGTMAAALIAGCGNWRMLGRQGVGMTAPCLWVAPVFLSLKRYTKCRLWHLKLLASCKCAWLEVLINHPHTSTHIHPRILYIPGLVCVSLLERPRHMYLHHSN